MNQNTLFKCLFLLSFSMFSATAFAQFYNFDGLTPGSVGNFANGWIGNPGTTSAYSWRADNGGTPSSNTGPAVDHTQGNSSGIYMYTEASSSGNTATLESPNLNLAGFTTPALSFWYHKVGASMGDLYVDVFNGTNWILGVDSIIGSVQTATTDPWLNREVSLTAFSGTIKVRFRAETTGGFSGDMAIDDVSLKDLPPYDLSVSNPAILPDYYTHYPVSQSGGISFGADITNFGALSVTNPTLKATVGTWQDSSSVATIAASGTINLSVGPMTPQPIGLYSALLETFGDEPDTIPGNNTITTANFYINDSIFARDDSIATDSFGIGASTTGLIGQKFTISANDTLTSISFYLSNPTQGDTTWVTVHPFNILPGLALVTSDPFIIPSSTPGWYTLKLSCPILLNPGNYLIAVREGDQYLSVGTTTFNYKPNTCYTIFAGNPWRTLEFYGFPRTLLLRANFGRATSDANAGVGSSDSTCTNAGAVNLNNLLTGEDPGGNWNDDDNTGALNNFIVNPSAAGPGTFSFTYTVADACGFTDTTAVSLTIIPAPNAGINANASVCLGEPAFDLSPLIGFADLGGTWSDDNSTGALNGSIFDPSVSGAGTFNFTYTVTAMNPLCNDESATVTVTVNICPAIDPSIPLSFDIYPNPNQGRFRVDAPGSVGQDLEIRVMDLTGREIYLRSVPNSSGMMEIDLGEVSSGVYLVELSNGEAKTQGRLIVE